MSVINNVINKNAITEFEFPEIEGFFVKIAYVPREELTKIRKASLEYKYDKKTHQREEVIDDDKFLERYAEKVIVGWRGLKFKHLPTLFPADLSTVDPETEIEYSPEEALQLLKVSVDFDRFVTDTQESLDKFSKVEKEQEVKNLKTSSTKN